MFFLQSLEECFMPGHAIIYPLVLQHLWKNRACSLATPAPLADYALNRHLFIPSDPAIVDTCILIGDDELARIMILNGVAAGQSLRELIDTNPRQIIGHNHQRGQAFPLSIAILAVADDQPLQVYPDANAAAEILRFCQNNIVESDRGN